MMKMIVLLLLVSAMMIIICGPSASAICRHFNVVQVWVEFGITYDAPRPSTERGTCDFPSAREQCGFPKVATKWFSDGGLLDLHLFILFGCH